MSETTAVTATLTARADAALSLPGTAALPPAAEAVRVEKDVEGIKTVARAQGALNDKVESQTGEVTRTTVRIVQK